MIPQPGSARGRAENKRSGDVQRRGLEGNGGEEVAMSDGVEAKIVVEDISAFDVGITAVRKNSCESAHKASLTVALNLVASPLVVLRRSSWYTPTHSNLSGCAGITVFLVRPSPAPCASPLIPLQTVADPHNHDFSVSLLRFRYTSFRGIDSWCSRLGW